MPIQLAGRLCNLQAVLKPTSGCYDIAVSLTDSIQPLAIFRTPATLKDSSHTGLRASVLPLKYMYMHTCMSYCIRIHTCVLFCRLYMHTNGSKFINDLVFVLHQRKWRASLNNVFFRSAANHGFSSGVYSGVGFKKTLFSTPEFRPFCVPIIGWLD